MALVSLPPQKFSQPDFRNISAKILYNKNVGWPQGLGINQISLEVCKADKNLLHWGADTNRQYDNIIPFFLGLWNK
jgi:hypothetical protein